MAKGFPIVTEPKDSLPCIQKLVTGQFLFIGIIT